MSAYLSVPLRFISHEPSHVAVFRKSNPSLQVPNLRPLRSTRVFTFFISFSRKSFGKQMYPLILSPFSKYNGFNFLASSGYVLLSLCQLSGLTLYVEQVMCLTPEEASFSIRLSALSLTKGIMGSIRAEVAMPFLIRLPMASRRSDGRGVFGSKSLAYCRRLS